MNTKMKFLLAPALALMSLKRDAGDPSGSNCKVALISTKRAIRDEGQQGPDRRT